MTLPREDELKRATIELRIRRSPQEALKKAWAFLWF